MESKPGYKTTEFWLSLVAILVGAALASGAIGLESVEGTIVAFVASALTAMGYTASRTLGKSTAAKASALTAAAEATSEKK